MRQIWVFKKIGLLKISDNRNPNSHLTVKERIEPSLPTRFLLKEKRLAGKILDFGCGLGADVDFLRKNKFDVTAYDKHYFPEYPQEKFDTIICNYVLNVLLPEEQTQVLMEIAQLLKSSGKAYFAVRRDIKKNGFVYNPKRKVTVYQCNAVLPFQSIFKTEYCEIYEYQHYTTLHKGNKLISPFFEENEIRELIIETATVFAIKDKFPVNEGHALVIPKRLVSNYFDLDFREQTAIWLAVNKVKSILTQQHNPYGFNVGFNVNEAGGQTVFHTHIHVIPRYKNDVENPKGGIRNVIPQKADYTKQEQKKTTNFTKPQNTVLVAIMNDKKDFLIAKEQLWYRIPVKSAPKNLRENNVKFLAFYQTKIFENEQYSIRWYAEITKINIVKRSYLFPDEPKNPKTEQEYYKLEFAQLLALPEPIISKKNRRITFIPTTEYKFFNAKEINYLFNDSVIEDKFWEALVQNNISSERQYHVSKNNSNWFLDFAIFCKDGNINIECDGDTFHTEKKDVKSDKIRSNELESLGWSVLRFHTDQIEHNLENSINVVKETINKYGGVKDTERKDKYILYPKDDDKTQIKLF
ncbi:MAG: HIT domain-containing protein [Thermoflexibacter sp.]|nr:HIT domain-containing protein [Thermoflexibacter sp.]